MQESDDVQVEMLAAAFLAGEGNKQVDIATMLGISQARVSRLLADARSDYLREEVTFIRKNVPEPLMQRVLQRVARKGAGNRLRLLPRQYGHAPFPEVRVFDCRAPASDAMARIEELGIQAAPYIKTLLTRSHYCGVTWGGMLRAVVSALGKLQIAPPWRKEELQCIPLSGEPLGNEPVSFSSSNLAHDLGNIVNGSDYNAPSLAMVPAFIPEGFTRDEIRGVRKLIGLVKSYDLIFGKHGHGKTSQPLAEKLDMILTSVGPANRALGFGQGRLFETGKVTIDQLQEIVIGDMGGVCFPKTNLKRSGMKKLEDVNNRWTGLRVEHLQACARKAQAPGDGPPGIVVVSGGKARAQFILEAVKLGLINHLIIDDELANELANLSAQEVPLSRAAPEQSN